MTDGPGMFCRRCSADLAGLSTRVCPQCGRRFNPADPLTFAGWPFDPNAFARSKRRLQLAWYLLIALGSALAIAAAILFAAAAYMMH